jgi:membrane protein implicated in regulation of membrane protease activity
MVWWLWVILGFLLLFAELTTPGGFFFVFFGGAAILIGVITSIGLGGPAWLQWLLFPIVSLASAGLFRPRLVQRLRPHSSSADIDDLSGQAAIASEDIFQGATGQVQMRASTWSARNLGPGDLAAGQRCRIERSIGIVLEVRPLPVSADADAVQPNSGKLPS